jgi:hypothetical protein
MYFDITVARERTDEAEFIKNRSYTELRRFILDLRRSLSRCLLPPFRLRTERDPVSETSRFHSQQRRTTVNVRTPQ